MAYPYPFGRTVAVLKGTPVVDPYSGEETRLDWTNPTEVVYTHCAVAPRTTDEPLLARRFPVFEGLTVYGPEDIDAGPRDRIRIGDTVYDIDGEIARWRSPFTGNSGGSTINVTRTEG